MLERGNLAELSLIFFQSKLTIAMSFIRSAPDLFFQRPVSACYEESGKKISDAEK